MINIKLILIGISATGIAGLGFSFLLGGPVGILGYGLILAGIGSLIDDSLVEKANKLVGL
ncbi:colicin-like pore-forming protein [Providencia alcalifaciens]